MLVSTYAGRNVQTSYNANPPFRSLCTIPTKCYGVNFWFHRFSLIFSSSSDPIIIDQSIKARLHGAPCKLSPVLVHHFPLLPARQPLHPSR